MDAPWLRWLTLSTALMIFALGFVYHAIWLESGTVKGFGPLDEVLAAYRDSWRLLTLERIECWCP